MNVACRKCPYFEKRKDGSFRSGALIMGHCKLRDKLISDKTITEMLCKDRAVISQ